MRCFDSSAPEPELGLRQRGSVRLKRFEAGQDALAETLGYLEKQMLLKDAVVLVTEEGPLAGSSLAGCEVTLPTPTRWQIEVRRQFDRVLHFYERHGMRPPPGGEKWIVAQLVKLSPSSYPTYEDVEVVRSVAREFSIDRQTRAWIDENPLVRNTISFRDDGEGPRLRRRTRVRVRLRAAEVVLYFEREDWPRGLSRPRVVVLQPFYLPRAAGTLPLYLGLSHMALPLLYSPGSRASLRAVDTRPPNRTQNKTESNAERLSCLSDPIHPARCSMGATFPYAIALPTRGRGAQPVCGAVSDSNHASTSRGWSRPSARNSQPMSPIPQ